MENKVPKAVKRFISTIKFSFTYMVETLLKIVLNSAY